MVKKASAGEKGPKECRSCKQWKALKARIRVAESLGKAISAFEERTKDETFKPTVGEYIKLIQLEQEAEQRDTKEIKVTWVDPQVTSESEK